MIYTLQVFIGVTDLNGVVGQRIAHAFMVGALFFGTLILTNLLIALMSTKFQEVSKRAAAEVMYNKAELTYDLSKQTSRMMPPPLNLLAVVVFVIVWSLNLFVSCVINPKWNVYAHL